MTRTRILVAAALLSAVGATALVAAALPSNIAASAADPKRAESAKNDSWRHGPEILAFAGVKPGAKVIDLIPGGGYWTRLFAGAVGPKGHVYGVWPDEYVKVDGEDFEPYKKVAALYPNVSVHTQPAAALAAPEKVDLVFTSQNYHDYPLKFMGNTDVALLNKAAFAALKPGGIYLVIDHAAEAGSGMRDIDKLHRIDGAIVKQQVEAAGFKFVGESPLLVSATDDKTKNVFAKEVRGHTDQFIYKFRKP